MNVRVEAGSLSVSLTGTVIEPTIKVEIQTVAQQVLQTKWTCFTLAPLSVNGHSVSAINPEFALMGGTTTL